MKLYNKNQSPLYKINSHARLAQVLGVKNKSTLQKLKAKADQNYYHSTVNGRSIQVPLSQLRRIHKRIDTLLRRIAYPDYLYSGIKGRSNVLNAKQHNQDHSVLKVDIKNYYPSITRQQIARRFRESFKCSKDVSATLASLCTYNNHLPTGSPVSLSLSFAVNRPVFDHINKYSKDRKISFTCYVDDMTFSGPVIPLSFTDYIVSYLKKSRGFECHKIRKYNNTTTKLVTGVVIDSSGLKVRNKHRKIISELLYKENSILQNNSNVDKKTIDYYQILIGHLFSAGQINGRYRQLGLKFVKKRKAREIPAKN